MSSAVDSGSRSHSHSQSHPQPHLSPSSSGIREPSFSPIYNSSHVYTGRVSLDEVEVTKKYSPAVELGKTIPSPGLGRADVACDREHPSGSLKFDAQGHVQVPGQGQGDNKSQHASVLQQHVMFFDYNNDGVITPRGTYYSFRKLDFSIPMSILSAILIHSFMSYATQDSWVPDPFFRIIIKNIHRGIHGSDSNVFDREGRFSPQAFEDLFAKFDHDNKRGLYWNELLEFLSWNRDAMDFAGMFAARFEWGFTWLLAAETASFGSKILSKETLRQIYDGTLFEAVARKVEERKEQKGAERAKKAVVRKGGGAEATSRTGGAAAGAEVGGPERGSKKVQ